MVSDVIVVKMETFVICASSSIAFVLPNDTIAVLIITRNKSTE